MLLLEGLKWVDSHCHNSKICGAFLMASLLHVVVAAGDVGIQNYKLTFNQSEVNIRTRMYRDCIFHLVLMYCTPPPHSPSSVM